MAVTKRRGSESKGVFHHRLKREGRWDAYLAERDALTAAGRTVAVAHNEIYDKYAPEIEPADTPDAEARGDKRKAKELARTKSASKFTGPEDTFAETLPNGCPLFDEVQWKGKPQTNLLDDVQWVAGHLGLREFDYVDRSPSLRACTLYWEARYTNQGMARYQELLRQLEIPDKATLKQLNTRKDDGAELNRLNDFLVNYEKHTEEQG